VVSLLYLTTLEWNIAIADTTTNVTTLMILTTTVSHAIFYTPLHGNFHHGIPANQDRVGGLHQFSNDLKFSQLRNHFQGSSHHYCCCVCCIGTIIQYG
jgi:hypothetical protein